MSDYDTKPEINIRLTALRYIRPTPYNKVYIIQDN